MPLDLNSKPQMLEQGDSPGMGIWSSVMSVGMDANLKRH